MPVVVARVGRRRRRRGVVVVVGFGGAEEAVDDGIGGGVAEGEDALAERVDDDRDLGPTENAELTCFLEKAHAPLGEGDLAVAEILDFLDLDLFPALGGFLHRGGAGVLSQDNHVH